MRFLYEIIFSIFALFYLPSFILKGKWNRASLSRFGILPKETRGRLSGRPVLWVHAVSVGEVGLAIGFLNRLRDECPETQFLITTTTVAGYDVAQKIKNEEDALLYFPADFRWAVRSFVRQISPGAVVLFETELWPNLIRELAARQIPVGILNGRISDRAFKRYGWIKPFLKSVLKDLSFIGAQDERMRERFVSLGASQERVIVPGNLKFDWAPVQTVSEDVSLLRRFCKRPSEFLWVAGSTHEGEEEILLEAYARVKKLHPTLRLLLAPRHLNRNADLEKLAAKKGIPVQRISTSHPAEKSPMDPGVVWILDQMGVLAMLYAVADTVFVGGSLVPAGGHNLVEPAFFEKAILFGPFMQNFLEMAEEFKKDEAAVEVRDGESLSRELESLIIDPNRRRRLGESAGHLVKHHQGATEKSMELLMTVWQTGKERKLVSA